MLKYKAIIFDFDGVILDSVDIKTKAFSEIYSPFGSDVEQRVIKHHQHHGGISRYIKIAHYHQKFLGIELSSEMLDQLVRKFSELVFEQVLQCSFITGAKEFLDEYYQILPMFIATGTPQKEIEEIVNVRGMTKYFQGVFGSPTVKEDIIREILFSHQLNNTEVLFVGDAMTDFLAAGETELDFIGVSNSDTKFPDGTILVEEVTELAEFL